MTISGTETSCMQMMLFGFLSSFHCIGMCGGSIMTIGSSRDDYYKNSILYHSGRLFCAGITGAIAGGIGSLLGTNPYIAAMIPILCGGYMVLAACKMVGIGRSFSIRSNQNTGTIFKKARQAGPAMLGIMTALLPCGMLQMARMIALDSGSWYQGWAYMSAFVLGTIPVLLLFGRVIKGLTQRERRYIQWLSAILILYFAIKMIRKGIQML